MRYTLLNDFPNEKLLETYPMAVTIYMPTHRTITEQEHDQLVYKNLVKQVEDKLYQTLDKSNASAMIDVLHALEADGDLWNESLDGLALFATPEFIFIYRLENALNPVAYAASQFYLKPLMQAFQTHNTVILLALNVDRFQLYKANENGVTPLKLPADMATQIEVALGKDHTETYHTHGMYANANNRSTFHGHGGSSAEDELDNLRFFTYVNRVLTDYLPNTYDVPVILVALDHLQAEFRKLSTIATLEKEGIEGSIKDFREKDLLDALRKMEKISFNDRVQPVIERYHALKKDDLSAPDSNLLMNALNEGRVETLLIEAAPKADQPFDENARDTPRDDLSEKEETRLNTMIHLALAKGAEVFIINREDMPDRAKAAGLFRYSY